MASVSTTIPAEGDNRAYGPSPTGAYVVLYYNVSRKAYDVVGRFDGASGGLVNDSAALTMGKNGKYAAFLIADGTVTEETLQTTTENSATDF